MSLLKKFEDFLTKNLPSADSFHPNFQTATTKMLTAGGKRFRPMLLLKVVESKEPLLINSAMHVALGIEFLHTYSLIHDDLPSMDNAPLRRGEATLHTVYDDATAILVGDGLNSESFKIIANAPLSNSVKIDCIKALSFDGGFGGMVLGQAIDLYFENKKLSLEELKFLHIHKTARLIASSLKMGAIIVNYDKSTQEKLYDFGIKLGLLFQMQDDILDEIADEKSAGKTIQNDEFKNNFVNLLGLKKAIKESDKLANELNDEFKNFDKKLKKSLKKLLKKYLFRHKNF